METGRLAEVVDHWMPRIQVAGIAYADAARLVAEAEGWRRWCATWCREGERHVTMGEDAEARGRRLTAGEAYVRAALYFHFGQFMFFDDLKQKAAAAKRKVAVYARAAPLLAVPAEPVSVPFEDGELRGYLRRSGSPGQPLAILIPGSDSTKEEFFSLEEHFLKRGLATFSFDGPGQGEGRRLGHLRPDWGPVLRAVLDTLEVEERSTGPVGVMGMAFGGYFALQGAAGEPRVRAVVSMNGFFNLGGIWDGLPAVYRDNLRFALGGETAEQTRERGTAFSLEERPLPSCPILVVHGGRDRIFPVSDARAATDRAGPGAEWVEFPDGNHVCNNVAYAYRPLVADWLAERLGSDI